MYHVNCFTCSLCHGNLDSSRNHRFKLDNDGEPICLQCELGQAKTCHIVVKPILSTESIFFDTNHYHRSCFYCTQCRQSLVDKKIYRSTILNPVAYHVIMNVLLRGVRNVFKPISSGKSLVYNGRKYHSDCFRCNQCSKTIMDNEFATHDAKPCCLSCYHEQFAPKCSQCLKAITYGDYINHDEKKYHPDCFRCNRCNKVIIDVSFRRMIRSLTVFSVIMNIFVSQCTQCLKPISVGQTLTFNEKKYHPDVFVAISVIKLLPIENFIHEMANLTVFSVIINIWHHIVPNAFSR